MKNRLKTVLPAFLIVLAVFAVYGPSFSNGFIWDDDDYVTRNPALDSLGGLRDIWFGPGATPQYYPLVFTSFWLEKKAAGLDPAVFHAVNAALHALAALLFWRLLALLGVPGAWFAAAIFAVHPINVESVAWITERKNVLSGVFYFGAAMAFLKSLGFPEKTVEGLAAAKKTPPYYLAAFVLFICALLSKTVTSTLPASLVLVLWWKRGKMRPVELLSLAPFFLVSVGFGLVTVWMERTHVGAGGADFGFGAAQRVLLAGRALWFYAGKILWPRGYVFIYPRVLPEVSRLGSWLYPASFVLAAAVLWLGRKRLGRGPVTAVLLFALALFPALGFFNVYPFRFSFVADHFQYLAGPCLMALFAAAAATGVKKLENRLGSSLPRRAAWAGASVLLVFLGAESVLFSRSYDGQETLWTETLQKNPDAWIAHNNLGAIKYGQGRFEEAESHFKKVIELKPDYVESMANLGALYYREGKAGMAGEMFLKALAVKPELATTHMNLAELYEKSGKTGLAIKHYSMAAAREKTLAAAYEKMAFIAMSAGREDKALNLYGWAVEADPSWVPARERLGTLLAGRGRYAEALPHLLAAFEKQPGMKGLAGNLGFVCISLGRAEEAVRVLSKAADELPPDPRVLDLLGVALALSGKPAEGAERIRQALAIDPGFVPARQHLAQIPGAWAAAP